LSEISENIRKLFFLGWEGGQNGWGDEKKSLFCFFEVNLEQIEKKIFFSNSSSKIIRKPP
jgi:hypothetical protein